MVQMNLMMLNKKYFIYCILFILPFSTYAENGKKAYMNFKPFTVELMSTFLTAAQLDANEKITRRGHNLNFSYLQPVSRSFGFGLGVNYTHIDFTLKDASALATLIGNVKLVIQDSFNFSIGYRDGLWLYTATHSIGHAHAKDIASYSSSVVRSYNMNVMRRFKNKSLLGIGLIYIEGMNNQNFFPYLIAKWQINKDWSLTNPFNAGFSGRAGLELVYEGLPPFNIGVGGAFRMQNFLAQDNQEVSLNQYVYFVRAGWNPFDKVYINTYMGYLFGGELRINDSPYSNIGSHMGLGLSFKAKF